MGIISGFLKYKGLKKGIEMIRRKSQKDQSKKVKGSRSSLQTGS